MTILLLVTALSVLSASPDTLTAECCLDFIVAAADPQPTCDISEFVKSAQSVNEFLFTSDDLTTSDAVYRSPAMMLREQADRIERRDVAVREFRDLLANCEWLIEGSE